MIVIGHRGAPSLAHENTLESFNLALLNNVDGLEFDVQLTKDHQYVVYHDYNILYQNQQYEISQLLLSEIKAMDLGFIIPTFDEVLNICSPDKIINVEIKAKNIIHHKLIDQVIYKIRPIDFDQQSYEGKLSVYRPQFFKENIPIMDLVRTKLNHDSINQYKIEERSIVARRIISSGNRLEKLLDIMKLDVITVISNLERLQSEIYKFTKDKAFLESKSMGDLMQAALNFVRFHYQKVDMQDLI